MTTLRPDKKSYPSYYRRYVDKVADGDIVATLSAQMTETQVLLSGVPPHMEEHRYAPDKWSVREVVGHCIDTERVFAFRTLWIARGAAGGQPSMDQDAWAAASNAGRRTLASLAAEWSAVRRDYLELIRSLEPDDLARVGTASRRKFTAGAFPWITAGHELHHRAILRAQYGLG